MLGKINRVRTGRRWGGRKKGMLGRRREGRRTVS